MKLIALALLAGGLMGVTGCSYRIPHQNDLGASPSLSSRDRGQAIDKNWAFEGQQFVDDVDSLLLLRPSSRMTIWNTR